MNLSDLSFFPCKIEIKEYIHNLPREFNELIQECIQPGPWHAGSLNEWFDEKKVQGAAQGYWGSTRPGWGLSGVPGSTGPGDGKMPNFFLP